MATASTALAKLPATAAPYGKRPLTPLYPGAPAAPVYPVAYGHKAKGWMALHIGTAGLSRVILQRAARRFGLAFQEVAQAIMTDETRLRSLYGRWQICQRRNTEIFHARETVVWNDRRERECAGLLVRLEELEDVFMQLWDRCQQARLVAGAAHLANLAPCARAREMLALGAFLMTRTTSAACTIAWLEEAVGDCERTLEELESFLRCQTAPLEALVPWKEYQTLALRCHTLRVTPTLLGTCLDPTDPALGALQRADPEALLERCTVARRHLEHCDALLERIAQAQVLCDRSASRLLAYTGHPGFTPLQDDVAQAIAGFQSLLDQGRGDRQQMEVVLHQLTARLTLFHNACDAHTALQRRWYDLVHLRIPPLSPRWTEVEKDVGALLPTYSPDCPQIQALKQAMNTARTAYEQLQAAAQHAEQQLAQRGWTLAAQHLDDADRLFRIWSDTMPRTLANHLRSMRGNVVRAMDRYSAHLKYPGSFGMHNGLIRLSVFVGKRTFYARADQMALYAREGRYDLATKLADWVDEMMVTTWVSD
ncbi:MAG: hypothetical protein HYV02_07060 [Deltaproteobacteria bacterium]|nr:hypothetical protein [Deltaproteobacteria bacterium]